MCGFLRNPLSEKVIRNTLIHTMCILLVSGSEPHLYLPMRERAILRQEQLAICLLAKARENNYSDIYIYIYIY